MRTLNAVAMVVALPALAACQTTLETHEPFDPNEGAYIHNEGIGVIEGQAFMRQAGGAVVTCAGEAVHLAPVTVYSMERIGELYGNTFSGSADFDRKLPEPVPGYWAQTRQTTCDAEGDFKFVDVPDGEFFVLSSVRWSGVLWISGNSYNMPEGGSLFHRVRLYDGRRHVKVLLHP